MIRRFSPQPFKSCWLLSAICNLWSQLQILGRSADPVTPWPGLSEPLGLWNTAPAERHVGAVTDCFTGNIWRLISSIVSFPQSPVLTAYWLRHFRHYNRSFTDWVVSGNDVPTVHFNTFFKCFLKFQEYVTFYVFLSCRTRVFEKVQKHWSCSNIDTTRECNRSIKSENQTA